MCTLPVKKDDIVIFVIDNENDGLLENENDSLLVNENDYLSGKEKWKGWINFVEENLNIYLPEKKLIFCLNKSDLMLDENIKEEKFEYLQNIAQNEKLNGEVLSISAKTSDGILNLKSKIKSFAVNITKSRVNKNKDEVNIGLFGPSLVGKTSLINRIINNDYEESTIVTLKLIKKECYITDSNSHEIKVKLL